MAASLANVETVSLIYNLINRVYKIVFIVSVVGDYDSSSKALGAMCEIALEACGSWFPQDNK